MTDRKNILSTEECIMKEQGSISEAMQAKKPPNKHPLDPLCPQGVGREPFLLAESTLKKQDTPKELDQPGSGLSTLEMSSPRRNARGMKAAW